MFRIASILILTLALATPVHAGYNEGFAAYQRGDYATALREWRPLAERGGAKAQFGLGLMYDNGWGVPQNDVEAVKWYRLAAEQGDADAQSNLGVMYGKGEGVPENAVEAVKWWRLAAEQGNASAQLNLGVMYGKGEGVPENDVEAVKWWRLAAEQGHAKAQFGLGSMYDDGQGVPENDVEAVRWYRLAAEQGHAWAQSNLGVMYFKGEGVPESLVHAFAWWNLAAAQGDKNTAKKKDILRKIMTAEQIAQAQRLICEWKKMPLVWVQTIYPETNNGPDTSVAAGFNVSSSHRSIGTTLLVTRIYVSPVYDNSQMGQST